MMICSLKPNAKFFLCVVAVRCCGAARVHERQIGGDRRSGAPAAAGSAAARTVLDQHGR